MAKALNTTGTLSQRIPLARSLQSVQTLRLVLGYTAMFGALIFLLGTSWDIQWHQYIGRDRTLIPPHIMMLTGVTLSGLAGLAAIVIESMWARRSSVVASSSTHFSDIFYGPIGAYIVGFAALNAAIAFPLDSYWHALYGIDVAIWAPFHIMFGFGMATVGFGAVYMLASAANLARSRGDKKAARWANLGVVLAFAVMMSIFTLLLFDSIEVRNFVNLGFTEVSLFPLLAGVMVTTTLVAAVHIVPWRWAATAIVGFYLLFAGIMALAVQPATAYLLKIERLSYRHGQPVTSIVALEWFLAPLIVAILIDVLTWQARRRNWSARTLTIVYILVALIATIPIPAIYPIYSLYIVDLFGIGNIVFSLLFGLIATTIGTWFGRNAGASLQALER